MNSYMNKFMALLFALLALGAFGLSNQHSYTVQDRTRLGESVGQERKVYITEDTRTGYRVIGAGSMVACIYFIARIRRDDLRK